MPDPTPVLPDPLPSGDCCQCIGRKAVTTDGRFCRRCLLAMIERLNPIVGRRHRGGDQREEKNREPSGWQENAVRDLEDAG